MKKELINIIEQGMLGVLNNEQLTKLHEILECSFSMYIEDCEEIQHSNDELLTLFLSAKQVEGCSERSLKYYRTTLSKMNENLYDKLKLMISEHTFQIMKMKAMPEKSHLITLEELFRVFLHGLKMKIIL